MTLKKVYNIHIFNSYNHYNPVVAGKMNRSVDTVFAT